MMVKCITCKGRTFLTISKRQKYTNGLEGFWRCLKRNLVTKLTAKGGIRKEKLPIYLGEYV